MCNAWEESCDDGSGDFGGGGGGGAAAVRGFVQVARACAAERPTIQALFGI
jgi:hypothetical protein